MRVYKIKTNGYYMLAAMDTADKLIRYYVDSLDFERDNGKRMEDFTRADITDVSSGEILDARDYQREKQIPTLAAAWKQLKEEVLFGRENEILAAWNIPEL